LNNRTLTRSPKPLEWVKSVQDFPLDGSVLLWRGVRVEILAVPSDGVGMRSHEMIGDNRRSEMCGLQRIQPADTNFQRTVDCLTQKKEWVIGKSLLILRTRETA
jgi:hypothetical protein